MFEILDFDANFAAYSEKWMQMNKGKFKTFEQMEDAMPEVYMRWLNTPAVFLGGETPGTFFQKYSSAPELIKWMRLYDDAQVNIPDQLLDRITDLGSESLKPLMYTAKNADYSRTVRMSALNLIKELDAADAPLELCLSLIDNREEDDELADVAAEVLSEIAGNHLEELLSRLDEVNDSARETYLDILSNFPGDERIADAMLATFEERTDKTALYASFLGKLGSDKAIPALTAALDRPDINYLDYIELRNAIENLGGEFKHSRDFTGDPYYETLSENQD